MKKITAILALSFISCLGSSASVLASPGSSSVLKTKGLSFQTKNKVNLRYSSLRSATAPDLNPSRDLKISQKAAITAVNSSPASAQPLSKVAGLSFSIPKIGLEQQELSSASVTNMTDLDQKMLYRPIFDTLTSQPCLPKSSTYIMGHSEPANPATKHKPAVRIFQNLDKLSSGDIIWMQNQAGNSCQYKITAAQTITTALNGEVALDTFNGLYFPQVGNSSSLKIQTCVKGSATKRLVLTAIMI